MSRNKWDERKDLVDSWCCKRSVRYGGRPVCNALKVKVAGMNCMRYSSGSQWSCLRSSLEENGGREKRMENVQFLLLL